MLGQNIKGLNDPQNKNSAQAQISKGDFSFIDNIPVFTMKSDLDKIKNPNTLQETKKDSGKITIPFDEKPETQPERKTSPFLRNRPVDIKKEVPQEKPASVPILDSKEIDKKIEQTPVKSKNKNISSDGFFSFLRKKEPKKIKIEEEKSEIKTKEETKKDETKKVEKKLDGLLNNEKIEIKKVSPEKTEREKIKPEKIETKEKLKEVEKKPSYYRGQNEDGKITKGFFYYSNKEEQRKKEEEAKLSSKIKEEEQEIEKIKKEEEELRGRNEQLKNELTQKEKELNEKKENIQQIEKQLQEFSQKQEEVLNLNSQLEEEKRALEKIKQEENEYTNKNTSLENALLEKEKELSKKKQTIQQIEKQIQELLNKKQELDEKILQKGQKELADFQEKILNSEKKLTDLNEQLESQEKILKIVKQEEAEFREKNERLKNELSQKEKELIKQENESQKVGVKSSNIQNNQKTTNSKKNGNISKITPKANSLREDKEKDKKFNRVLIFVGTFFLVLIIGIGGYNLWTNKMQNEPEVVVEIPTVASTEEIKEIKTPNLSLESANYMPIDLLTNQTLKKQTIEEYAQKVAKTEAGSLVEFMITDTMNNPVSFENFASSFELKLNNDVIKNLDQDFRLYIYNYGEGKTRLGLSINIKNIEELTKALKENEPALIQGIYSIFKDGDVIPISNTFEEGEYNNVKIKYQNITTPDDYALDYVILEDNLIIGSTKSVTFSILDRGNDSSVSIKASE